MYNLYCTGLVSKHAIGEANEEALSMLTSQKNYFLHLVTKYIKFMKSTHL